MANEEHLRMLGQRPELWNRWREKNADIRPELGEADLYGAYLSEANLHGAYLHGADLSRADLSRADLSGADLSQADLVGADLSQADLIGTDLIGADLIGADLSQAELHGAYLSRAKLSGAKLNRVYLIEADLHGAELSGADLSGADLSGANLIGAQLIGAQLGEAKLSGANLSGANLSGAKLIEAQLIGAQLIGADLCGAQLFGTDLSGADLSVADLSGVKLIGADLSGAKLSEAIVAFTVFADLDLSVVEGLETIQHWASSTIGVDTIYRSGGKIPEAFLRGVGMPDTFITCLASVTGEAIQHYSCFISYSNQDEAFAERLHDDLQGRGVRCWFAPEDMRSGDRIRPTTDQSIRLHDKLLLILSEHSVASGWVEQEVEAALEREREQGRTILFPVRLDDTVMELKMGWPAQIKRTRDIGDFRAWKDRDSYQQAFDRLLDDLRAEGR